MDIQILTDKFFDYAKYMRGRSEMTLRRYRQVMGFYAKTYNIKELEEVNIQNLRELFFYGRVNRKWSTNTFINYHKSLSVFFQWCVKEGLMEKDLTCEIELPKLEKRIPPKLTRQEAMRLLEVVYNYPYFYKFLRHRNYAIFAMFIFSGIRKHELLNLKVVDVDLENYSIFIRQGKGHKDRQG